MEFTENQPIWIQIYDLICSKITDGSYPTGERLPSLRDLAMELQVNPNTVVRVYNRLESEGLSFNRRGVGYFVADNAPALLRSVWQREFTLNEVPRFFARMEQFGVDIATLNQLYQQFSKNKDHENQ